MEGEREFELSKLVRNKIPKQMEKDGQRPITESLGKEGLYAALLAKIGEEAGERDWPDLLTVIKKLAELDGMDWETILAKEQQKTAEKGGFDEGIFIRSLVLKENDPWVEYYASESRFIECREPKND